jgi:hypothetical protein
MRALYGAVVVITSFVIAFLFLWSMIDTPSAEALHTLSSKQTEDGETIVWVHDYCTLDSGTWRYLVALWHSLLLITASVLAFTTRKIKTDFNENSALTLVVYSHVVFVLLLVLTYTLDFGEGGETDAVLYRSLIFSADSLVTISIYFVSKFISKDEPNAGIVDLRTSQLASSIITPDGVRNATLVNWTTGGNTLTNSASKSVRPSTCNHREKAESAVFPSIMEVGEDQSSSSMEQARDNDEKVTIQKSKSGSFSRENEEEDGNVDSRLDDVLSEQRPSLGLRCRHCGSQVSTKDHEATRNTM